jgi:hypothetical protein
VNYDSKEWECAWCAAKVTTDRSVGRWSPVPSGWLQHHGGIDDPDIFCCSEACAAAHDNGVMLWQEFNELCGRWWSNRDKDRSARGTMTERHGADLAALLLRGDRETLEFLETDEAWKHHDERTKGQP